MKQYEDELARKRMAAEHELQRQRNAEMAKLQVGRGGRRARCAEPSGALAGAPAAAQPSLRPVRWVRECAGGLGR
jgi:hypothetical protein